jgi:hypothetical protein
MKPLPSVVRGGRSRPDGTREKERLLGRLAPVSWLSIVLLAAALAVLVAAEWPRLEERFGLQARRRRHRARRKGNLRLLETDSEDFAASVERDLSRLPTTDRDH